MFHVNTWVTVLVTVILPVRYLRSLVDLAALPPAVRAAVAVVLLPPAAVAAVLLPPAVLPVPLAQKPWLH
jgi:hypothetical protein